MQRLDLGKVSKLSIVVTIASHIFCYVRFMLVAHFHWVRVFKDRDLKTASGVDTLSYLGSNCLNVDTAE